MQTSSVAGLQFEVMRAIADSKREDAAGAAAQVRRNTDKIEETTDESLEASKEMRDLQADVEEWQDKAENTDGVGRFFGVAGRRQETALRYHEQAVEVAGEVETLSMDNADRRDTNKSLMDDIESLQKDAGKATDYALKLQREGLVVQP